MRIIKGIGIFLGVVVALVAVAAVVIYFVGEGKLNQTYSPPNDVVVVPSGAEAIARGEHITHAVSVCVECHGGNFGGGIVFEDAAIGRIVAPNLTKGKNGLGNELTDADFVRAIRYGVLPNGKSLRVMPADDFTHLDDADLGAVIAYVRSLPPVDSNLPPHSFGPLGRVLFAAGVLDIMIAPRLDMKRPHVEPIPHGVNATYGKYLADAAGCTGCHGPGLSGGVIPGSPPEYPKSANLTAAEIKAWSDKEFLQTIRSGVDPSGHHLVPEMPWKSFRGMTDDELLAIWQFVKQAPAKPFGNR